MTRQADLLPRRRPRRHRRARPDPAAPGGRASAGGGAMTVVGRKADHLRIAAGAGVAHTGGTGFERLRLRHRALPERNLAQVSLETTLLGARLGAPLVISAMTGGTRGGRGDQRAAGARGVPSTGWRWCSARAARCSTTRTLLPTYRSGDRPPLLLGNLGAAQVRAPGRAGARRAAGLDARRRRPDRAPEPDPGGGAAGGRAASSRASRRASPPSSSGSRRCRWWSRRSASGWTPPTSRCCATPAWRRSTSRARAAPTGRSSRAAATSARATSPPPSPTGACRPRTRWSRRVAAAPGLPVIASGGLRDGVDAAKALALGAAAAGLARAVPARGARRRGLEVAATLIRQLRVAVWAVGAASAAELSVAHLRE